MSEEIEKLKTEHEKKCASLDRQVALKRKVSDLELQLARAKRDLEYETKDKELGEQLENRRAESGRINLGPALYQQAQQSFSTFRFKLVTVEQAQEMIDRAMHEVLDSVKRVYGG